MCSNKPSPVWKAQIYRLCADDTELWVKGRDCAHQGKGYRFVKAQAKATIFETVDKARRVLEQIQHRHRGWVLRMVMV